MGTQGNMAFPKGDFPSDPYAYIFGGTSSSSLTADGTTWTYSNNVSNKVVMLQSLTLTNVDAFASKVSVTTQTNYPTSTTSYIVKDVWIPVNTSLKVITEKNRVYLQKHDGSTTPNITVTKVEGGAIDIILATHASRNSITGN